MRLPPYYSINRVESKVEESGCKKNQPPMEIGDWKNLK
jgi:hypothetical protein